MLAGQNGLDRFDLLGEREKEELLGFAGAVDPKRVAGLTKPTSGCLARPSVPVAFRPSDKGEMTPAATSGPCFGQTVLA